MSGNLRMNEKVRTVGIVGHGDGEAGAVALGSLERTSSQLVAWQFPNLQGSTQETDKFDLYEYLGDSWGTSRQ